MSFWEEFVASVTTSTIIVKNMCSGVTSCILDSIDNFNPITHRNKNESFTFLKDQIAESDTVLRTVQARHSFKLQVTKVAQNTSLFDVYMKFNV